MEHIRPWKFFTLLEATPEQRLATVPIPNRRGAGGISLLETMLLIAAVRIIEPRKIFEFGTFLGSTTYFLALNSGQDCEIFTLDLDESSAAQATQDKSDSPLTQMHLSAHPDFHGTAVAPKIRQLFGNSISYDCSPWNGAIDMIFIDGGHDVQTLDADTKNALAMLRKGRRSIILWHDYRGPEYPDLTGYLDDLSGRIAMTHIEDTKLVFHFGSC